MAAVGTELQPSRRQLTPRRRLPLRQRVAKVGGPYLLILPSIVIILAVLAYPIFKLFELSFQTYQLPQLIHESHHQARQGAGAGSGSRTSRKVFEDHQFWDRPVAHDHVHRRERRRDDDPRYRDRRLADEDEQAVASGAVRRPDPRVGDASGCRHHHLELAVRSAVRRHQLHPHQAAPRPLRWPRLVHVVLARLPGSDVCRRVGCDPVRRDHHASGADASARRTTRSSGGRRRLRSAGVSSDHLPDAATDRGHP